MGATTESEQVVLLKFKDSLADLDLQSCHLLSDMHLIRWLRARDLDIERAGKMLRTNLSWREENDIKNCLKRSIPKSFRSEFPVENVGFDRQGNVLVYIPYGKIDMRRGLRENGKEMGRIMRNYYFESIYQATVANSDGKVMKRFSVIIDFRGLTYMQFASVEVLELLMTSIQVMEQNYPELLGTGFMVNTPAVWGLLWAMAKPLLHQKTIDKIVITGSDPKNITEILEKHISKDNFPTKYGGHVELKYPEPVILRNDDNENNAGINDPQPENKSFFASIFGSLAN